MGKNWIAAGRAPRTWPWRRRGDGQVTAQVGEDGPRGPRDARGTYRVQQQQREEVQRHSETSYRARLSSNKVGAMRFGNRYKADNVEGAGSNRSGDRNKNRAGNMRSGDRNKNRARNMRSGDRNKNKAGNVKETGKEQNSGHFTDEERSKKLRFLGHEKIF